MMSGSTSPGYQQQLAASIKEVVNKGVLRPLVSKYLMGNGIQRQQSKDLEVVDIAAMYMDDGKARHPACFTMEQARDQFAAVLWLFDEYGIEYSSRKSL